MIDHTALRARKYKWLIRFIKDFGNEFIAQGTSIILYPNFLFSFALASFEQKYEEVSLEDYREDAGLVDEQ